MTQVSALKQVAQRLWGMPLRDIAAQFRRAYGLGCPSLSSPRDLSRLDSEKLLEVSRSIRGEPEAPAIFVHGIMPRSGTNYVADLLKLHASVHAHPARLFEFPLLNVAGVLGSAQEEFLQLYKKNRDVLTEHEFLALLAAGFMRHLQGSLEIGKVPLLKVPHVDNIELFHHIFPDDVCIIVIRDGRDVIDSYLKTFGKGWLKPGFSSLCRMWQCRASAILNYQREAEGRGRLLVLRYEDVVADPHTHVERMLELSGLDSAGYDFSAIDEMPVRGSSRSSDGMGDVHWRPVEKTADFNPVGRWHGWSRSQQKTFQRIAGETSQALGYPGF